MQPYISTRLCGAYKVSVLDGETDEVVWTQEDYKPNLILNNGMDYLAVAAICDSFRYAIAGTGSRVNSIDSSGSTAYVSASYLLLTGSGFITDFTATAGGYGTMTTPGDAIRFSDGTVVDVVSVSPTSLTVSPSSSIASGSFRIWKTSQTGLEKEVKRTNTYINGACGTTVLTNLAVHKRQWDFSTETSTKHYTEMGTGWAASGGMTTFSRIALPYTISVDAGQKLRFEYELSCSFWPITPTSFSFDIGGWPRGPSTNVSGTLMIQSLTRTAVHGGYHISLVGSNGATGGAGALDPVNSGQYWWWLSDNANAFLAFGSQINKVATSVGATGVSTTRLTYVTGSYKNYTRMNLSEAQAAGTTLRSFGFGYTYPVYYTYAWTLGAVAFAGLFSQPQTKYDTEVLYMTLMNSWTRTLAS